MAVWVSAGKGIRYREHESRKHGQRPDRYWCIRYKVDGREVNESVGWWSSGATKARCEEILTVLRQNHRLGHGPQTFRKMKENERQRDKDAALAVDDENEMTLSALWPRYIEWLSLSARRSTIRTTVNCRQTWFTQLADRVFGNITTADLEKMLVAPMSKPGKALAPLSGFWGCFRLCGAGRSGRGWSMGRIRNQKLKGPWRITSATVFWAGMKLFCF